jgi:hypothetical protein
MVRKGVKAKWENSTNLDKSHQFQLKLKLWDPGEEKPEKSGQ